MRGAIAKSRLDLLLGGGAEEGIDLVCALSLGNLGDVGGITEHNGQLAHDVNVVVGVLGGQGHEKADVRALLLEAHRLTEHGDGELTLDDALLGTSVEQRQVGADDEVGAKLLGVGNDAVDVIGLDVALVNERLNRDVDGLLPVVDLLDDLDVLTLEHVLHTGHGQTPSYKQLHIKPSCIVQIGIADCSLIS